MFKLILNLFADASTNVNKTTDSGMSLEMKTFYDTELLENARVKEVYAQFAKKQALPANHGKTVEWRKWNTFAKASQLQEGVIPTGQTFGMTHITDSIAQYGTYATISDELELHAYDDTILGATEEMGASAADTSESLIVAKLMTATNVLYCDNVVDETGKTYSTPTSCAGLYAGYEEEVGEGADAHTVHLWAKLTADMVNKAATKLKKAKVPTINGKYFAVVHPSVAYDLRQDAGWIEAHKYAQPDEIYNGEIGELHGVRFIENPDAPVCKKSGKYTNGNNGSSYATFFFGKDAFGMIDPAGGALQMIVHDKGEIGGPLNQFSTVGYKFETNGACILYPERMLRVMSVSTYHATDVATITD